MLAQSRPLWVIGDPHGGQDADADAALAQLIEQAADSGVDLLFMGDLFTAWLAQPKHWTSGQTKLLETIQNYRRTGLEAHFIEGNRDYFVKEELEGSVYDRVYQEAALVQIGTEKTLIAHGDGIDPDDLWYHRWKKLTRNRGAHRLARALPGFVGRPLAERLEKALVHTNQKYKNNALPQGRLHQFALKAADLGCSQALLGHYHAHESLEFNDAPPVLIAPAWFEHRRILCAPAGGKLSSQYPPTHR